MNIINRFNYIKKRISLKKTYYILFTFFIVIPIFGILIFSLIILNKQFKLQAIDSIKKTEQNIVATLNSEIDNTSLRLISILYANDNEIIKKASEIIDTEKKYEYNSLKALKKYESMLISADKNIFSCYFYSRKGDKLYLKNYINDNRWNVINEKWYQDYKKYKNRILVGKDNVSNIKNTSYDNRINNNFILAFVFFPDYMVDKSKKIDSVVLYFSSSIANYIKINNIDYKNGKNINGYISIVNENNETLFSTNEPEDFLGYEEIKTPINVDSKIWYVKSLVKKSDLTINFWNIAFLIILIAIIILCTSGYLFAFFIKSIVSPVEEVSSALKELEEGKLDIHVDAKGQYEVRTMIHRFNAVSRRLKALIKEYECELKLEKSKEYYISEFIKKEGKEYEIKQELISLFKEPYIIIGMYFDNTRESGIKINDIMDGLNTNSIYSVRCTAYIEDRHILYIHYRIMESDYKNILNQMLSEIENIVNIKYNTCVFITASNKKEGIDLFIPTYNDTKKYMNLRYLQAASGIVFYENDIKANKRIVDNSYKYDELVNYVYIADEKNAIEKREEFFMIFRQMKIEDLQIEIFSIIVALGRRFTIDDKDFYSVYSKKYDYRQQIERIEDNRGIRLWLNNYFNVVMKDTESILGLSDNDVIKKAKRYIIDNYDNSLLSLKDVADYVDLNEKYFSNRFTKETNEKFSDYLTSLRLQKAKELLSSTNFKIYEISQMVGYRNVEHFNRVFKKHNKLTPNQYRESIKN